jgi:hypothetical protein
MRGYLIGEENAEGRSSFDDAVNGQIGSDNVSACQNVDGRHHSDMELVGQSNGLLHLQ